MLGVPNTNIEAEWNSVTAAIVSDNAFLCQHQDDPTPIFWARALKSIEMAPDVRNIIQRALVVAQGSSDAERSFSIINMLRSNNRRRLLPSTIDLLVRIRMNAPPLESFDPYPYAREWERKGYRLPDAWFPKKQKSSGDDHDFTDTEAKAKKALFHSTLY